MLLVDKIRFHRLHYDVKPRGFSEDELKEYNALSEQYNNEPSEMTTLLKFATEVLGYHLGGPFESVLYDKYGRSVGPEEIRERMALFAEQSQTT